MNKMVKIAVIVPVYNGGRFLPEFLSCLERQTIKDFEVYFTDDASTDHTAVLLQEAVRENSAFHYIRNDKRCGAAFSRNRGIESSRSEYVLCLDADDLIADDLLEQLVEAADLFHADLVMLERENFTEAGPAVREKNFLLDDRELYERETFRVTDQPVTFLLRCQNATYDKMVSRSLLDRYRIRFQDLPSSNDVFYALFSFFSAECIVHTQTSDTLYYRRVHSEPDRISNDRDPMCAFKALYAVKEALQQYHMWEENCVHFWIFALDSLEKQLFVCKKPDRQREVYHYLQTEGLQLLGIPDDVNFLRLPECCRKQFERLRTVPYEEKCFFDSMSFHAVCECRQQKIADIFTYAEHAGLTIGFWGAGRMTAGFVATAEQLGKKIDYLIDNNEEKQGKVLFGMEVVPFHAVSHKAGLIIISNKEYYYEIFRQIKEMNQNIGVLCLQEYLYCGSGLEVCIR